MDCSTTVCSTDGCKGDTNCSCDDYCSEDDKPCGDVPCKCDCGCPTQTCDCNGKVNCKTDSGSDGCHGSECNCGNFCPKEDRPCPEVCAPGPVHEITFLDQDGTGGSIIVRVKVRTRAASFSSPVFVIKEETQAHQADWEDAYPYMEEESSSHDDETNIDEVIYKLYLDTQGCHNGTHTFGIDVNAYEDSDPNTTILHQVDKSLTISNLVVTSVNPAEYVIWRGVGSGVIPINVSISDNDLNKPMDISLVIWPTESYYAVRTITLSGVTGANHTFEWDGKDDSDSYVDPGPYTYDVEVSQPDDDDWAHYRSDCLDATSHEGRWRTGQDGALTIANGCLIREFVYTMSDVPSSVVIEQLNGYYNLVDSAWTTDQTRTWSNPVLLQSPAIGRPEEEALGGRTMLRAVDTCGPGYRNHQNRRMLVWNAYWSVTTHQAVLQFSLIGGPGSHLRERARTKSGSLGSWSAWSDSLSWPADSGNDYNALACMNRRDREWVSTNCGYSYSAGCTPHISDITVPPYRVNLSRESDTDPGYTVTCNGESQHWKYRIYDRNGVQEWIYPLSHPYSGCHRQNLQVHPDGGSHGTQGCIGIWGTTECDRYNNAVDVRAEMSRLRSMQGKDNIYLYPGYLTATRIPLFVTTTVSEIDYTSYVYWFTE